MTNNKIIKALDEAELFLRTRVKDGQPIKSSEYATEKLRNISQTCAKASAKITRQQTENENLTVENQSLRTAANSLKMHYEEAQAEIERLKANLNIEFEKFASEYDNKIKAEAVKEFAARLKEKSDSRFDYSELVFEISEGNIDNLVKEMAGENK